MPPNPASRSPLASVPTIAQPAATASARRRRRRRQRRVVQRTQPRRSRRQARGAVRSQPAMTVDPCTAKYAQALVEPWDSPPGACLPAAFPVPSGRRKLFARFTVATSSGGFGFIAISPGRCVSNDGGGVLGPPQTTASIYYSAAAYAGNTLAFTTATTGCNAVYLNSDYGSTDTGIKYRLVSIGVKITNTTTALNTGGVAYCLVEPDHKNLGAASEADLAKYDQCRVAPISLDCPQVTLLGGNPTDPAEMEFNPMPSAVPSFPWEQYCMAVILRTSAVSNFYVDVTAHVEYIGTSVRSKEVDNASVAGLSAVSSAFQSVTAKLIDPHADKKLYYDTVLRYATMAGAAIPVALAAATGFSTSLTGVATSLGRTAVSAALH